MPSSQGIGIMTVIALSGCTVMLLVLGRQKLLELKKDCYCLQAKLKQEGAFGSHSSEHQQQQHAEGGAALITRRMQSGSQSSPDKKRNLVKKVRFSQDVVEPSGDNVAYRRRHALALKPGQLRSQMRRVLGNIPANRMALYVGICNDRSDRRLFH